MCVVTLFCVVMTCCSCDYHYGGVCYARGVGCRAGYAESVVLLLLSYATLSLVTASAIAVTMVRATSVMNLLQNLQLSATG